MERKAEKTGHDRFKTVQVRGNTHMQRAEKADALCSWTHFRSRKTS